MNQIERFGGIAGLAMAEALFSIDSRGSAKLLYHLRRKVWPYDETALLALSIDDLLGAIGLSEPERLSWHRTQTDARSRGAGDEFRRRKNALRSVLGHSQKFLEAFSGGAIAAVLRESREGLTPVAQRLRELANRQILTQSLDTLCASFIHLHFDRMLAPGLLGEYDTLNLLLRTRESLEKAPASADRGP